jgi:fructose-1-phosphate kinase PfkB-like protein
MSVLVVGSVALDTVITPFGKNEEALGGSATYFSLAASYVDVGGLEMRDGKTFRWVGKYGYDLNQRDTLATHLNVFEHFHPKLPELYRSSEFVFLGNIHPNLQLEVLDQISEPKFIACDTMNMWIENEREALCELIKRVDAIVLNDSEARELAQEPNLAKAARKIHDMGCRKVVIKKGEHGCLFFTPHSHFSAPAYPLELVNDPTGAGDAFAGGFMGYLSQAGAVDDLTLRRAIIYGSVLASFTVEMFGIERLVNLSTEEILSRYEEFQEITRFQA